MRSNRLSSVFALVAGVALVPLLGGCGNTRNRNGNGGHNNGKYDASINPFRDGGTNTGSDGGNDSGMPPWNPTDAGPSITDLGGGNFSCSHALTSKPQNAVLYVDGTHAFPLDFHLYCGQVEITSQAAFSVANAAFGVFSGHTFSSTPGAVGTTQITAGSNSLTATTNLTLKKVSSIVAPGTPSSAPSSFGGASDPSVAPQWV